MRKKRLSMAIVLLTFDKVFKLAGASKSLYDSMH